MRFKHKLLKGSFIKRYKRFFVDIKYKNKILTAHCPNTGSMMGLLDPGNNVWFSKSDNPKRKLKYTLEIIDDKTKMVGINTHLTNKIVLEALKFKKIDSLKHYTDIKTEIKVSNLTRFDFLISNYKAKCYLEVKNVTLVRKKQIAEFPDSITSRGTKHMNELIKYKKKGFQSCILYLIQRDNCTSFSIADDIDKNYKNSFDNAISEGVKVLCYDCKISNEEIKLNKPIKLI